MPAHSDFLQMGVVGKPHGLKGELSVIWRGEFIPGPKDCLILKEGDVQSRYKVKQSRFYNNKLFLAFDGIDDRTSAERLTGAEIYIDRADLPPLAENEVFLADLIGARILSGNGEFLGILDHIVDAPGQEIWAIRRKDGSEMLFPAREEFIKAINSSAEIIIDPPPGLLDIYNA